MKLDNKFIKFLLVGVINTIFGYSVYAFFMYLDFHYTFASLLSTILGVLFNFKTIGKLVFKSSDNKLLYKFIGVYTITYIINISFLKVFNAYKINMYYAGAILILPMAVISFFINNKYVFKEQQ